MSRHATIVEYLGETNPAHSMALQAISVSTPRHRVEHEHDWRLIAEFTGRRAAIYQCSDSSCEQTRTIWRTEADT
jgi:hypothetical protein